MTKAKIVKKDLLKFVKRLNKLELNDDPIMTKGDVEDIAEDFIQAIEEIDDSGKIDKVKGAIVDYYEELLDVTEDEGDTKSDDEEEDEIESKKEPGGKSDEDEEDELDDLRDELEDMNLKEVRAFIKEKSLEMRVKKKKWNDDDEQEKIIEAIISALRPPEAEEPPVVEYEKLDEDSVEEACEDMSYKELKQWLKDQGVTTNELIIRKSVWEEDPEDYYEAIAEACNKVKLDLFPNAKEKKVKEERSEKREYPKGIRKGTMPAVMYDIVKDAGGEATLKDLAKAFAEVKNVGKKKKDQRPWRKWSGEAMRTISRKVSRAVPVIATFTEGNENDTRFSLGESESE